VADQQNDLLVVLFIQSFRDAAPPTNVNINDHYLLKVKYPDVTLSEVNKVTYEQIISQHGLEP